MTTKQKHQVAPVDLDVGVSAGLIKIEVHSLSPHTYESEITIYFTREITLYWSFTTNLLRKVEHVFTSIYEHHVILIAMTCTWAEMWLSGR